MDAVEKAGFLAHARTAAFNRRLDEAQGLVHEALGRMAGWCVSFSGGKDSTVVLDLVLQAQPDIPVCWLDDGWDYPETLAFLEETEARLGRQILRVTSPVMSPFWKKTPYPGDAPHYDHPSDMDFDRWRREYNAFIGLRMEESGERRILLRSAGPIYYSDDWQHWACCPLARWTVADVWAYIVSRGLPYNSVYDKLAALGVPLEYRRVGPLTAWMVWKYGMLAVLRAGWPDLYNRFLAAFPDASRWT